MTVTQTVQVNASKFKEATGRWARISLQVRGNGNVFIGNSAHSISTPAPDNSQAGFAFSKNAGFQQFWWKDELWLIADVATMVVIDYQEA